MKFFARKQSQRLTNYALAALLVFSTITASVPYLFSETANAVAPIATSVAVSANTSPAENSPGWMFNRDLSTVTPYSFSANAASTGAGSLYVAPISSNASDKFIGELFFDNQQIADLNSVAYDINVASGNATAYKQFYANVYANYGGSALNNYYNCRYNVVPAAGADGVFRTVTFDPASSYTVTTRSGSPTCPASPADMGAGATIRAFAINVGDTSMNDTGVSGYIDNVIVNTSSLVSVYDFEPAVVAVPANIRITKDSDNSTISDGATVNYTDATMKWNTVANAERYQIRVTDPNGATQAQRYTGYFTFDLSDASRHGLFGTLQGEWAYEVRTKDATSGAWSAYSTPLTLSFDSQKPTVVQTSPASSVFQNTTNIILHAEDNLGLNKVVANIYKVGTAGVHRATQVAAAGATMQDHTVSTAGLVDGDYYVKFNTTDKAGNLSATTTYSFTIDNIAPAQKPTIDNMNVYVKIGDANKTLSWTHDGVDTTTYEYREYTSLVNAQNDTAAWTKTVPASQKTTTDTASATSKVLYWRVVAVDAAGNRTISDDIGKITIDREAPVVSFQLAPPAFAAGTIAVRPVVAGELGGSMILKQLYIDNVLFNELDSAHRNFDNTIDTTTLPEGEHTLKFVATDEAGNSSTISTTFIVDNISPVMIVKNANWNSPIIGAISNGSVVSTTVNSNLRLFVTDANIDHVLMDGITKWTGSWITGNGGVGISYITSGTHTFQAVDKAGNTSGIITLTFDNSKPNIQNVLLTDILINNTDASPVLSADLSDASSNVASAKYRVFDAATNDRMTPWVAISAVDGSFDSGSEEVLQAIDLSGIADGNYVVKLRVYDQAGNVKTKSVAFTIDRTSPTAAITTLDALTANTVPTVNGTYVSNDLNSDTAVTLSIDGGAAVAVTDNLDGTWSYTPAVALSEGVHTFIATAADVAENATISNTLTLTIDSLAPDLTVVSATSAGNTPTVTGTAEVGSTLSVTFNGVTSAIANNNGSWTFTSPIALENGTYTFAITATDAAGNETLGTTDVIVAVADEEDTAQVFTVTPAAISPAAAAVLGTTSETADADVEGISDDKTAAAVNSDANQGMVFGIAWYWWILILAGLSALAWFIIGAIRRRNEANS